MEKLNLAEAFARIPEPWSPRLAGELNGQHVRLVRCQGEFIWHQHAEEDELFLVLEGHLRLELRHRTLELQAGELCVVPRGTEHRPVAPEEALVLLFEPASTCNTGQVEHPLTCLEPGPP